MARRQSDPKCGVQSRLEIRGAIFGVKAPVAQATVAELDGRSSTAVQLEEAGRAGVDSIGHASWNDAADPMAFGQPHTHE